MSTALKFLSIILIVFGGLTNVQAQPIQPAEIGTIEVWDDALRQIINQDATFEVITDGLEWSEGPLWLEKQQMLLFSDVPTNIIYKWTAEKGKEIYLTPSGYTGAIPRGEEVGSNGLALDRLGRLVICQHGDRRIALMDAPLNDPKPSFVTLADKYKGKRMDSPNDLAYHPNGSLYFTDPPYGLINRERDSSKESPYQGIYKVAPNGDIFLLTDSITRPNGIAFFPGHKKIIIANSDPAKPYWYEYAVDENGFFQNGKIFFDARVSLKTSEGMPDGLKIDKKGNVFATGPGGVWIFNEQGKPLGRIRLKSMAANCAFSEDEKTLFITADAYVLKVKLR